MRMPETARYTDLVARDARQAEEDMSRVRIVFHGFPEAAWGRVAKHDVHLFFRGYCVLQRQSVSERYI
ncbi:hypothetical protein SUGI_0428740 [Cryptomeria japonica]|nr:hypothetical protein SUGI_0428740 [Cryptomeria japonica]